MALNSDISKTSMRFRRWGIESTRTDWLTDACIQCSSLVWLKVINRDYVDALKKPIRSKYSQGLFVQYPSKNGIIYNISASLQKLQSVEKVILKVVNLFKQRLEWLTSGSRCIFGVIHESRIIIIIDGNAEIADEFDDVKALIELVVHEQLTHVTKYNIIRSSDMVQCWQQSVLEVNASSIEQSLEWIRKMPHNPSTTPTSTAEAILTALSDDQLEAIYLVAFNKSYDAAKEILKTKISNRGKPIHVVAYNCHDTESVKFYKEFAASMSGNFHNFLDCDRSFDSLMESLSLRQRRQSNQSDSSIKSTRNPLYNREPNGNRKDMEIREDILVIWEELEQARHVLAEIQALQHEVKDPKIMTRLMSDQKVDDNQNVPVKLIETNSEQQCDDEDVISSVEYLKRQGLVIKGLSFYDFLSKVAFKHCDGVENIQKPPEEEGSGDAVKSPKLINAKYCDRFVHVRWKDGTIVHVHVSGDIYREYERKMRAALKMYNTRIDWLLRGSRELFGTIIEDQITILVDTSSSMRPRISLVKDKLHLLLQEQLIKKKKFNIIKFSTNAAAWRDNMADVTDQNLLNAWQWIKGLAIGGSTNTLAALKLALGDPGVQGIYLLTDGRPDQPPDTVLSQIQLYKPIPVHTISFNCNDSDANEFLSKLAYETGGRFHYYTLDGEVRVDESGLKSYESQDTSLLRKEIQAGEQYLARLTRIRNECIQLEWNNKHKSRMTSSRPASAENDHNTSSTQKQTSKRNLRNIVKESSTEITQTRTSKLRAQYSIDRANKEDSDWILPESRQMLNAQREKLRDNGSISVRGMELYMTNMSFFLFRWISKYGLVAKKLTIIDALAPSVIRHNPKHIPIINKDVMSKVFDEVMTVFHANPVKPNELKLINPLGVDLDGYEKRLLNAIDLYERKLNGLVWEAIDDTERSNYQDYHSDDPPSFGEYRESMMVALQRLEFPVSLEDIELLEEEIRQANIYLQQAKDLKLIAAKNSKSKDHDQNTKRPVKVSAMVKGQRVVARSSSDGFYYAGTVIQSSSIRRAEIEFDNLDIQVIPTRFIISVGGAQPNPFLQISDYVLVRTLAPDQQRYRYIPGIVQSIPNKELPNEMRYYAVVAYNGRKLAGPRNALIKIAKSRYAFTCRYITGFESSSKWQSSGGGRDALSEWKTDSIAISGADHDENIPHNHDDNADEGRTSANDKSSSSASSSRTGSLSSSNSSNSGRKSSSVKNLSDPQHHSVNRDGSESDSSSSTSDASSLVNLAENEKSNTKDDDNNLTDIYNESRNHSPYIQSFESKLDDFQNRIQQQEIVYMEKLEAFIEQSKVAKNDQLQEKLVENQNKQIELQQQLQEHQNRLLDEQQKFQQRYNELYNLQRQQLEHTNIASVQRDAAATSHIVVKDTETQTPRDNHHGNTDQLNDSFFNLSTQFNDANQAHQLKNNHRDEYQMQQGDKQDDVRDGSIDSSRGGLENKLAQNSTYTVHDGQGNQCFEHNNNISRQNESNHDDINTTDNRFDHQQKSDENDQFKSDHNVNLSQDQDFFQDQQHLDGDQSEPDQQNKALDDQDSHHNDTIESAHSDNESLKGWIGAPRHGSGQSLKVDGQDVDEPGNTLEETSFKDADIVIMDHEEPALIVHENGRGFLLSRKPPTEVMKPFGKSILKSGEEVLSRWSEEGWYYRGTILQYLENGHYVVQDEFGDTEVISRIDIISDDDDDERQLKTGDAIIGLHPSYNSSYAPGVILAVAVDYSVHVRFYDLKEAHLPREEVYYISNGVFERDVAYIQEKEDQWINRPVVARNDKDGYYHLGRVHAKASLGRQYLIQWAEEGFSVQSAHAIFGELSKKCKLNVGDYVLAIVDPVEIMYLPGQVVKRIGKVLVVAFCNDEIRDDVEEDKCFPLSSNYYEEAAVHFKSVSNKQKHSEKKSTRFEDKQANEIVESGSSSDSSDDKRYTYFARQSFRTSERAISSRGDGFNTYMF
ncbi:uncharacterized protein TRIADDRAFT_56355 [Trichoplax adhaerens]|uniref:VWFA domain-containing protein n=1 Tax=Trichoplax adhaerens TaxID=10228 RepID=B3RXW6_TRIAD|nr:hypothetical protein TRIADDRAFT_56355 [Trichoplax adhaerens]EDV24931.1 hypothetical protein TRIADDRAFT_56355 [Trichoplax adhaerens]|eukprot:XP_002112821.1 hypothetical protein TRIADDRAFT_56355 [Trichoplax adhaerens]